MFLGIDLGTSSVKIVLLDAAGVIQGEASAAYPSYGSDYGVFEQEPDDWTDSILKAAAMLRQTVSEALWEGVEAIGLSAQMPTLVVSDRGGTALDRAIVWCDNRAQEQSDALQNRWGEGRYYTRTGIKLDGRYLVPMYRWIAENKPELLKEPHYMLSAKDYLYFWMCGKAATDPSTASGYAVLNIHTMSWDSELCREAEISEVLLPEIIHSDGGRLPLKDSLCRIFGFHSPVAVCIGAADSVAGILGAGAAEPGTVCQICGSSTAMIAICENINIKPGDPYFITPLAKPGTIGMEADMLSTGSTSRWLASLLGKTTEELSGIAKQAPPGSEGVLFAPYLAGGEQGVLWDASLSAGIMGLSAVHNMTHIVRAHYEGICFEARRCLEAFEQSGAAMKKVILSGPVTRDSFYMQLMADILGRPCYASAMDHASAYGAALLAGIHIGKLTWNSLKHQISDQEEWLPDANTADQYDRYYLRYLDASAKMNVTG